MDECNELDFLSNCNDNDDFVDADSAPKMEKQRCSMCKKDLSHLDLTRRSQHLNRCLDKKEIKTEAARLRGNYDRTRDCPLCFEPLAPGPHRIIHYKRCSKEHNVSAAEMNEMISHNDKVAQIRRRCGISHTRARQQSTATIERNLSMKMSRKDKIGPKSLADEQLQTALALSRSESYIDDPVADVALENGKGKLKQARIPTLLESTDDQMRFQVLQERLLELILSQAGDKSGTQKENGPDNGNWRLSRWWSIQANESTDPGDYQIEMLKNGLHGNDWSVRHSVSDCEPNEGSVYTE